MAQRPKSRAVGKPRRTKDDAPTAATVAASEASAPARRGPPGAKRASPEAVEQPAQAASSPAPASKAKRTRPPAAAETQPSTAPASKTKPARKSRPSAGDVVKAGTAPLRAGLKAKAKRPPPRYLAAELGQPVDHEGEPIGAGSPMARSDKELQDYTLQLWRQMQSRRGVNRQLPAMERAGVTIDDIWTAGVTNTLSTSSTPDEVRRYRQKVLFRANLLEAILTETVAELRRLDSVQPTPPATASEPG